MKYSIGFLTIVALVMTTSLAEAKFFVPKHSPSQKLTKEVVIDIKANDLQSPFAKNEKQEVLAKEDTQAITVQGGKRSSSPMHKNKKH